MGGYVPTMAPSAAGSPEDPARGPRGNGVVVVFFRALTTAVAVSALGLTGSAAAQAAPAPGGQLTGTQLASALLPLSYFPTGSRILWHGNSGSRLEHPAVKVNQYTYSCTAWAQGGGPDEGFGETAFAPDLLAQPLDLQEQFQQWVYQFPSAAAAASYYRANYALTKRCETVTLNLGGTTQKTTTQFLTNGHADGYPAFFQVLRTTDSGEDQGSEINDEETVLAGRDVISTDRSAPPARTLPSPSAATLALIARLRAAQ